MRKKPLLKRSLLSYAIALAASGMSHSALAVDLCAGEAAMTVGSGAAGNSCTLDVTGAKVTVSGSGKLTDGIYVSVDDGIVSNQGTVSQSRAASSGGTSAYAISAGALGATAKITNSGVISADAISNGTGTGADASAYGIHFNGNLTGSVVTNSGRISTNASGVDWGGAYGIGSWSGVTLDGATIKNASTGRIVSEASGDHASAYGIYGYGAVTNGTAITNSGEITALAHGQDANWASAWGIYQSGTTTDSTITNSGTINAMADSTGSEWVGAWGIYASSLNGDSALTNSGTIKATASSGSSSASAYGIDVSQLDDSATLTNSGRIIATAQADSNWASAYGISFNNAYDASAIVNSGSITAAGTSVSSDAYAYGIDGDSLSDTASIRNTGSITATADAASWASAYGISVSSLNGTSSIGNSGTIKATASSLTSSASANGIRFDNMATGTSVTNSGRITVEATVSATDNNWAGAYGVGSWSGVNPGGSIENAGVITAHAEGSRGSAYGIFSYGDFTDASVSNSGTIIAATHGNDGSYASAYGIYMEGNRTDVVIGNSGRIVADAAADGSAWAGAFGIRAGYWSYGESTVDNSGTITATASSADGSASAYGMQLGVLGDATAVTNSGSITAAATAGFDDASAYGILTNDLNSASVSNSSVITARADMTGSGSSDDAYAYGIRTNSLASGAALTNSGTIVAEANAANGWAEAYGIQIAGSVASGATIANTGTIHAAATGSGGEAFGIKVNAANSTGVTVDNSGLVDGGVSLNGGMVTTMFCMPMGPSMPCMPIMMPGGAGTISLINSGAIVTNAGTQSRVDGNYTQGADGALGFRVASSSDYASLSVRDTADFTAGNKVHVLVDVANQLQDGDSLADVISAGTLTLPSGEFTLTDNSLFWDFEQIVDGNTLDLTVSYLGVAPVLAGAGQAFTDSQLAFVDQLVTGGYGTQFSEAFEALNGAADAAAAADILEGIGPVLAGAAGFSTRTAAGGATKAVSARMGETRGASSGDTFSSNSVWIKPYLGKAEQDSVDGVDGYDVDTIGVVIGIDGNVSDSWRLGVAVATAQSDVEGDKANLDADTTQFTLYGSYAMSESASLDLDLNHAVNSFDSTRRVVVSGSNALSSYDGSQLAFGAKMSNRIAMGEKSAFIPSLLARYQRVDLDGYSETGAGVYNLTIADSKEDSLLWAAEGAFEIGIGAGALLASAGIGYDTLDAASVTATLNGGAGPTFISNGIKPESTVVTGGLGYRYVTAKSLEINVAYDAESRGDFLAQTASVKFKLPF